MKRVLFSETLFQVVRRSCWFWFLAAPFAQEPDRERALVVTGAAWGPPPVGNILIPNPAESTTALVYETLFSFNPLKNEYRPWLAESGGGFPTMYVLKLRRIKME